jgi:hypothetical protein
MGFRMTASSAATKASDSSGSSPLDGTNTLPSADGGCLPDGLAFRVSGDL